MLNKEEQKTIQDIKNKYYMAPVVSRLDRYIKSKGHKKTLSYLHQIIIGAKKDVMAIIKQRKKAGLITDISQASKAVVGQIFTLAIVYVFLLSKKHGLVRKDVFITTKIGKYKKLVAIKVDGETQKPDMDLVIYSKDKKEIKNMIIVSLKTSLRERAGQTYKWKLLLEIATTKNSIKNKYHIEYPLDKTPIVCFATVNFYNEINNPQHRGMFKFFDKSFIGKPIKSTFIDPLSSLIDFANVKL